jgi:hypothetical protein
MNEVVQVEPVPHLGIAVGVQRRFEHGGSTGGNGCGSGVAAG